MVADESVVLHISKPKNKRQVIPQTTKLMQPGSLWLSLAMNLFHAGSDY